MEIVGTILFAPTVFDIGIRFAICTMVTPAFSISLFIVAPQRVQVPHVDVRMTAPTFASRSSAAISLPILAASPWVVPVPTVE